MVNEWGPAILVCLTVVVGFVYNSKRMDDLRSYMESRFAELDKRMEGRFSGVESRFMALDKRIDDLKDWIRAEIRRLEERSSPIQRG